MSLRVLPRAVLTGALLGLVPAAPGHAQGVTPLVTTESGVYGEAYRISGRDARRPDQTMRAYLSPSVSWMGLTIGGTLLWSTENDFTAQTMNRFYLNPRWRWGELHAGDYVPVLNRFTASAVRVRGGGFALAPGRLRVAATAGRASEPSDLSPFDAAPRRLLYSGLLGVGAPDRTFIEISALRAVDTRAGTDTLSATPQENLVGAAAAGLAVGRLRLKGEWSTALFSRDTRASQLDSLAQPEWTKSLFTARLSSRLDHAWSGEARVDLGAASLGGRVEQVGPGYTTLGNPYMPNDQRDIRLFGQARVGRGRLSLAGSAGVRRDNLAGDKRGTTYRRTGQLAITHVAGAWLVSSATLLLNGLTSDPTPAAPGTPEPVVNPDSFRLKNLTRAIAVTEQVRFGVTVPQTITLAYAEQVVNDDSPRLGGLADVASRTVTVEYGITVAGQVALSLRPGYQRFRGADQTDGFASLSLGLARRAARSPWTASLATTYTQLDGGRQLRGDATLSYRLWRTIQIAAQVRHTRVSGVAAPFNETLGSVRVTKRW
jgi:hypothetical protein